MNTGITNEEVPLVLATPTPFEQDVLLALSEEVHRLEAEKKGATIDLPQYFQAKASVSTDHLHGSILIEFAQAGSESVCLGYA